MRATIRRWGNSAAVRLGKRELDRLGLREGDAVEVEVRPVRRTAWDVSMLPVFRSGKPTTLAEARAQAAAARLKELDARR